MAVVKSVKKPVLALVLLLVVLWYMVLFLPKDDSVVYVSLSSTTGTESASVDCSLPHNCLNVSIYVESFDWLNSFYPDKFGKLEKTITRDCVLPQGGKCILQHTDTRSDVLFRMVYKEAEPGRIGPTKYFDKQLLAVLNTEAEVDNPRSIQMQQLSYADIRISYHPSSDVFLSDICYLPLHILEKRKPPDPRERKGIALFLSDCRFQWRTDYIRELMDLVHIDSYGLCFHNVPQPSSRDRGINVDEFIRISSKYRMVITFENTVQTDYMSEKINMVYQSGAIPVYWGPPEIYSWVPGDHSFIDASKFSGPQELATYLKNVEENDELFRFHTTNFDLQKSWKRIDDLCVERKEPYMCRVCRIAHGQKAKAQSSIANPVV